MTDTFLTISKVLTKYNCINMHTVLYMSAYVNELMFFLT